jgi:hypothetical protein
MYVVLYVCTECRQCIYSMYILYAYTICMYIYCMFVSAVCRLPLVAAVLHAHICASVNVALDTGSTIEMLSFRNTPI